MEQNVKPPLNQGKTVQLAQPGAVSRAYDLLLRVEGEARQAQTVAELAFLIANETGPLAKCRQVFVLAGRLDTYSVKAVTSIGSVDRNAPRIRWFEAMVRALAQEKGLGAPCDFVLPAFCPPDSEQNASYPFRFFAWLPFRLRDGTVFGGMLLTREMPWVEQDLLIARRLSDTYAHAWAALTGERRLKRRIKVKPLLAIAGVIAVAAAFYPVPMTVLAPVEVAPVAPRIIAAPLEGVIENILVNPDQSIRQGEPLIRMSDIQLRNELAVAEQAVNVASAKLMQVTQGAVADPKLRADLAVTRSELTVAVAKRDYARDMLARTDIRSPADGVAIYSDKRDWIGRPVTTGERIMEVADPKRMQLRIDVPVADAIAISPGASVWAFLDSDPLRPAGAKVVSASFEARLIEGDILAYRIYATLDQPVEAMRLGIRGTAQISGEKVFLAYYLFRKPISFIRQRFGL